MVPSPSPATTAVTAAAAASLLTYLLTLSFVKRKRTTRGGIDEENGRGRVTSIQFQSRPPSPLSSPLPLSDDDVIVNSAISTGGYESLIGNTPLLYLPRASSLLLPNRTKIYVKMESANPGGTGKDRAARSMILEAERRGELPPPMKTSGGRANEHGTQQQSNASAGGVNREMKGDGSKPDNGPRQSSTSSFSNIPPEVHDAILIALRNTRTNGVLIEGTSGSTGISLASLSCARGHAVIVVMPDDQSKQKVDFLKRLGCGVVVVRNCGISNPGHYVNVARRVWEWLHLERRYDGHYWENVVGRRNRSCGDSDGAGAAIHKDARAPKLIRAAFMNQFENLANVQSHYCATGPEIHSQLNGKVDAFVMSAGTGGTLVGTGGYLKEKWWRDPHHRGAERDEGRTTPRPPRVVLVDPPGSSLFNKVKYGVAYASQQSEQRLRRHRYDTLAEGIGLDRITANFGLGCEGIAWGDDSSDGNGKGAFGNRIARLMNNNDAVDQTDGRSSDSPSEKIIDDAVSVTDQQAVYMAHYLLRHEGLFVGSSTAMNVIGALRVASEMPPGSNVVTVVCDGGYRHTGRFWNRDFVVNEWGLVWPGDEEEEEEDDDVSDDDRGRAKDFLKLLGIDP